MGNADFARHADAQTAQAWAPRITRPLHTNANSDESRSASHHKYV
jgi:hypothetical protein